MHIQLFHRVLFPALLFSCFWGQAYASEEDLSPTGNAQPEPSVEETTDMDPRQDSEIEEKTGTPVMEKPIPPEPEIRKPYHVSLTVSGGVSLGAYQAGYLFYLSEVAKLNPELFDLKMLTGASAGMVNAMLTMLAMGDGRSQTAPGDSLLYKTWTQMRYDDLLDVKDAPPLAMSSRKTLRKIAHAVEAEWNRGISRDIDVVMGATATRLKIKPLEISPGFSIPRQEEKFVFRIRGQGPGREPLVENYVDRSFGSAPPLLPFQNPASPGYSRGDNFSIIRQILFASSAIPIFFSPQKIDYCIGIPESESGGERLDEPCPEGLFHDEFYDGALADKRPLRLAHKIASSGLEQDEHGDVSWMDEPDYAREELPAGMYFLYVDPDRRSYPTDDTGDVTETAVDQATSLFPTFGKFMRGFLSSAQAKEVATLVEENPSVKKHIQMVTHDYPTMSGHLLNFFGFFDRNFRRFDFYLGMRDAHHFITSSIQPRVQKRFNQETINIAMPDPIDGASKTDWTDDSWRPYFCLRHIVDGQEAFKGACDDKKLRDFRILMQVSIDRLYDHCRSLLMNETLNHHHCKLAMMGLPPPRVVKHDGENGFWKRRVEEEENPFSHTMRLLETYQFHFRDLGLDRDDASLAMSRIREVILKHGDEFAKKLPFKERLALRIMGKPAVNFFMYAPPETILYFVAGTGGEFAVSATLGHSNWLRYNFAWQMQGMYFLLTENPNVLAMTPLVGLEAEIYPASNPLLQTRIGARVGYQLSTGDRFHNRSCISGDFQNSSLRCSAPVSQAFIAFSFYERIRLQIGFEWFPRWLPPMSAFNEHVWNGIIEVGWQWISPF